MPACIVRGAGLHGSLELGENAACRFEKIFVAYRAKKSLAEGSVRFAFDGTRLTSDQTPEQMDMEDGDIIEACAQNEPRSLHAMHGTACNPAPICNMRAQVARPFFLPLMRRHGAAWWRTPRPGTSAAGITGIIARGIGCRAAQRLHVGGREPNCRHALFVVSVKAGSGSISALLYSACSGRMA